MNEFSLFNKIIVYILLLFLILIILGTNYITFFTSEDFKKKIFYF